MQTPTLRMRSTRAASRERAGAGSAKTSGTLAK